VRANTRGDGIQTNAEKVEQTRANGWQLRLALGVSLAVAACTVAYVVRVMNNIPLSDEWAWVGYLLVPYEEGRIGWRQYITGQYTFLGHSHFITLGLLLLSYRYFGLGFWVEPTIGVVSLLAGALLLGWQFARWRRDGVDYPLAVLVATVGYFCITSDFPWLLVLFEYFYFTLALALLVAFDLVVRGQLAWRLFLPLYAAVLLLADSIGIAACVTVLAIAGLAAMLRLIAWRRMLALVALTGALLLAQRLLLGIGIPGSETARGSAALALLASPGIVVKALLSSLSQPLVDNVVLKHMSPLPQLLRYAVGSAMAIALTAVLALYFRQRAYTRSLLPLLLVGFSLLSALAILASRFFDGGESVLLAQRFTRLFTLYIVGFACAAVLVRGSLARIVTLAVAALSVCTYMASATHQWRYVDHVRDYFKRAEQLIRDHQPGDPELGRMIARCADNFCDPALEHLRTKRLHVFRSTP
jgi:hypothetical protein